jgi:acetyl esterase/lipase
MRVAWFVVLCGLCALQESLAQDRAAQQAGRGYPPQFADVSAVHTYKTVGEVALKLYVFAPAGHQPSDRRAAIVFFFGGGWQNGSPAQFHQQCRYLASRGMVAITADYRVGSRHGVKVVDCVRDAKSAIRWVREHAAELGVDPHRIVAAGGSAGGHLAACTGTLREFDEAAENAAVSSRPNALVLFNPALGLAADDTAAERRSAIAGSERWGVEPQRLSPADHVDAETPPTLILIGTNDFLLPGNRRFAAAMRTSGRQCELTLYEGASHGFFNFGRQGNTAFLQTLTATDRFLASLGYLQGEPQVESYFAAP